MKGSIERSALESLQQGFRGCLLRPDDDSYAEARTLFNAMIDRRPGLIAQCADTADVVRALQFGRAQELEIAVRSGGHGVAGKALNDGGLVIDLRRMHAVTVDASRRTATVEGGATMSHFDRAMQPFGLATTGGRVSSTGIGGLTLGGGNGWLDRKFGLVCDNLLSVELVTADGEIARASETENVDLFWALHGGGGNFGVATSFTFQLHDLPVVTTTLLFWAPERGPDVLRVYRDFLEAAPDEIGGGAFFLTGPAEPFVPEHLVGRLALLLLVTYAGCEADARRVAAPLLALSHEGGRVAEMPYAELQCMIDDPSGYRNYWTAEQLASFPDRAIERFCERAADMIVPSPSQHVLFPQGGVARRSQSDFPIAWRDAPWCVHPFGLWREASDDERAMQWARSVRRDLAPWATGDVYLNFIGDEGQERVLAGYGARNYARLAAIKAKYDPDNVFRSNHNIEPRLADQSRSGAPGGNSER